MKTDRTLNLAIPEFTNNIKTSRLERSSMYRKISIKPLGGLLFVSQKEGDLIEQGGLNRIQGLNKVKLQHRKMGGLLVSSRNCHKFA